MAEEDRRENGQGTQLADVSTFKIFLFLGIAYLYKVTSLGTVLHEFAHQLAVGVRGYRVYEVDYFSHVRHDMPTSLVDALFISYAPLIVNTTASLILTFAIFGELPTTLPALMPTSLKDAAITLSGMFLIISFLFHAVPSFEDIGNIKTLAEMQIKWYRIDLILAFVLLSPFFVPTYLGLLASRKTGTRVLIDVTFTLLVLLSIFSVLPWWEWLPHVDWGQLIRELLMKGFEVLQKNS